MKEEMVHIVDDEDNVIDTVPRSEMRAKNLRHRATQILVFNSKGELFVHQRTFNKDISPGYYDVKVGGVVTTGPYDEEARRELEEEIGIKDVDLKFLFKIKREHHGSKAFSKVYKCIHDGPFKLQEGEIISGEFMSLEKVREVIKTKKFTPGGLATLKKYLEEHHERKI